MTIKVTRLRTFSTPWKQKLKISTFCLWNRVHPGAGEYTGPAARSVGKSLILNDGGDVNRYTNALLTKREVKMVGYCPSSFCVIMHQTNPATPSPLPPGRCGTFAYHVSPDISKFCVARGSGICPPRGHPRAFDHFDLHRWTESEQNEILKVNKWTMMASCSRSQFSPSLLQAQIFAFQQFLFFSSLKFFKYYPKSRTSSP